MFQRLMSLVVDTKTYLIIPSLKSLKTAKRYRKNTLIHANTNSTTAMSSTNYRLKCQQLVVQQTLNIVAENKESQDKISSTR